jgi:hypothetical protein
LNGMCRYARTSFLWVAKEILTIETLNLFSLL